MNQLSWLLYLASICENLGQILQITLVLGLISFALWAVIGIIFAVEGYDTEDTAMSSWKKLGKILIPILVFTGVVMVFIPSKDTVYAVAASQAGEQVVKSPLGQKAEKALESWLDKQIANTAEEKK